MEDNGLIEESSIRLLDTLEGRADTLLRRWQQERESRQALQQRLADVEAAQLALVEQHRELEARHQALDEEHRELVEERRRLVEEHRELVEENRELLEQSRELEQHNRRLQERLNDPQEGQGASGFAGPARRSRGLSALIGRSTPNATAASGNTPPPAPERSEPPEQPGPSVQPEPPVQPQQSEPDAAPSPQGLLGEWYRRYPDVFLRGHTRPLKVGIHEELAAREPWPEKLVRRALACYVNLPRYLKAVREGAERIDLQGQPAGSVDAQAAEHAGKKLERLQAERRSKAQSGGVQRQEAGAGRTKPKREPEARHARKKKPAAKDEVAQHGLAKPRPAAEASPVTMEEKLAALVAKHRPS